MLLSKIRKEGRSNKREVIGLIGAHPGAGVTYTALLLAFYFGSELGKKTAYLECNMHHDMKFLQQVYEWNKEESTFFDFGQITFYRDVEINIIPNILSNQFDCFILDFGCDYLSNRDELLRCQTKIILSGHAEWNKQKLLTFTHSIQVSQDMNSWIYLVPLGAQKLITGLRRKMNSYVYSIPYEVDPTNPSKQTVQLFDCIFNER